MKIYQIDSSARKEGSTSRLLAKKLLEKIKKSSDEVIYRDLNDEMVFVSGLTESGMNIAENKHKNIRAAQCFNLKSTKLSRLHNDANIIKLGSRLLSKKNALNFVGVFLNTKFEGGRHKKRIKKI